MSNPKDRPALTQEELEEMPGDPLPERAALSLIGSHSINPIGGAVTLPAGSEPPSEAGPLEDPTTGPGPDEA